MVILKNQLNNQLNIAILKKFAYYEMFCEMLFFSSQIIEGGHEKNAEK